MCTKWYYNNLATSANLSPSSENALYPAENIQDTRRTRVWRSTTNTDHIYFDFGSAENLDSIVLVDSLFNGFGFTTASLELNSVATWTSGAPVTISITIDNTNGIAFGKHSSTVNYRYAKLILTSTLGYCEVSKVFIGVEREVSAQVDFSYPLKYSNQDKSIVAKNRYNQIFVDSIYRFKQISGQINTMTNSEVDVLIELDNLCSTTKPFFVRFDQAAVNLMTDNDVMAGYYRLTKELEFSLSSGNYWNTSIDMEEVG